jgi:2-polyprenyl-3-methyl-5-hydroxy-6-metoxy-1,4-benzoquinol methylase
MHPSLVTPQNYYDERYASGVYMVDWPEVKKTRIQQVLQAMNLARSGRALDYGCGNGVLTRVLKSSLGDGWEVCGADISQTALAKARRDNPDISFTHLSDTTANGEVFDLIFSHHVLEHVADLDETLEQMSTLASEQATMLHICPCGNPGSLEHRLAALQSGIEAERGHRFFFEDEGHLRRVTTEEMEVKMRRHGFHLVASFFAHQRWGAVEWITAMSPQFLFTIADPSRCGSVAGRLGLRVLRYLLLVVYALRAPSFVFDGGGARNTRELPPWMHQVAKVAVPISTPIDGFFRRLAAREWARCSHARNGSEQFLVFDRHR